jgi:hypothetical protein
MQANSSSGMTASSATTSGYSMTCGYLMAWYVMVSNSAGHARADFSEIEKLET